MMVVDQTLYCKAKLNFNKEKKFWRFYYLFWNQVLDKSDENVKVSQ